jgi:hypothetical protein
VSPGTYVATNTSTLDAVDSARGDAFTSQATGTLNNGLLQQTPKGLVPSVSRQVSVSGPPPA